MTYRFLLVAEVDAVDFDCALRRLDGYREFANDCDDEVCLYRATYADLEDFDIADAPYHRDDCVPAWDSVEGGDSEPRV